MCFRISQAETEQTFDNSKIILLKISQKVNYQILAKTEGHYWHGNTQSN